MKKSNIIKLGIVATVLLLIPRRSSQKSSIYPKCTQDLQNQQKGHADTKTDER